MRKSLKALVYVFPPVVVVSSRLAANGAVRVTERSVTADYVKAMSVVDEFLSAWRNRAGDKGIPLLSPTLRRKYSNEYLLKYIAGLSNPHHEAFEVYNGRRLSAARYAFTVRLYDIYSHSKRLKAVCHGWGGDSSDLTQCYSDCDVK